MTNYDEKELILIDDMYSDEIRKFTDEIVKELLVRKTMTFNEILSMMVGIRYTKSTVNSAFAMIHRKLSLEGYLLVGCPLFDVSRSTTCHPILGDFEFRVVSGVVDVYESVKNKVSWKGDYYLLKIYSVCRTKEQAKEKWLQFMRALDNMSIPYISKSNYKGIMLPIQGVTIVFGDGSESSTKGMMVNSIIRGDESFMCYLDRYRVVIESEEELLELLKGVTTGKELKDKIEVRDKNKPLPNKPE